MKKTKVILLDPELQFQQMDCREHELSLEDKNMLVGILLLDLILHLLLLFRNLQFMIKS